MMDWNKFLKDIAFAVLAAISVVIGACLAVEFIRRYGVCVW